MLSHCQILVRIVIAINHVPLIYWCSLELKICDNILLDALSVIWHIPQLIKCLSYHRKISNIKCWSLSHSPLRHYMGMWLGVV